MGRLKDLFIERIPDEKDYDEHENDIAEEVVTVNIDNVTHTDFIADVYDQNELSDQSKSIFKVEEIINTLPKEMPNDTKRIAVIGILTTFGLTLDQVIADGEHRKSIIMAAADEIKTQNESVINENNIVIEEKKHEIETLEADISNRKNVISDINVKTTYEIEHIDSLIGFIGKE